MLDCLHCVEDRFRFPNALLALSTAAVHCLAQLLLLVATAMARLTIRIELGFRRRQAIGLWPADCLSGRFLGKIVKYLIGKLVEHRFSSRRVNFQIRKTPKQRERTDIPCEFLKTLRII